jgi:hypothetical protein
VHVVLAPDDEDALAGVTVRVRVLQDVEQVATFDMEDNVLEPDAALRRALRVLRDVCPKGTHWHRPECAQKCAQTRSKYHHPAANANQVRDKKRAGISKIPARSVISGGLSKPSPSTTRPPHRGEKPKYTTGFELRERC